MFQLSLPRPSYHFTIYSISPLNRLYEKVCVAQCPRETYSPLEVSRRAQQSQTDIKAKVREFCSSQLREEEFQQLSVAELVERRLCPGRYLASSPVLGRCLPLPLSLTNQSGSQASLHTVWRAAGGGTADLEKVERGQSLTVYNFTSQALAGLESVRNVVDNVLSDLAQSCWIITLHLLGAGLLSLAWILMLRCVGGLMVWISLLALIAILLLTVILSTTRLYQLSHGQEILAPAFLADLLDSKQSCWVSTILSSAILGCVLLVVFVIRQVGRGSISHTSQS